MLDEGMQTFRFDTFGDEAFWGDTWQLHQAIAGARLGGVGSGVSPKTALAVGLKVDAEALPQTVVDQIRAGAVNLDDPATTLALLKLNAVVGLTGIFDSRGKLRSLSIQCALCHSKIEYAGKKRAGRTSKVTLGPRKPMPRQRCFVAAANLSMHGTRTTLDCNLNPSNVEISAALERNANRAFGKSDNLSLRGHFNTNCKRVPETSMTSPLLSDTPTADIGLPFSLGISAPSSLGTST